MQFVWLITTLVEALPGKELMFKPGEKAMVQCFIPAKPLETALEQLDAFLASENYSRCDIQGASRFDRDNLAEDAWEGNLDCVEQVARTGKPCFGVFITCPEWTPSWEQERQENAKRKPWWKLW